MLRADQIELSILNLLVDWPDASGRIFSRFELQNLLHKKIGPSTVEELVDTLMLLAEARLISIEQFREKLVIPYNPAEGSAYFGKGDVRCKALPRARRRQQELAKGNRHGIFISHIGEEKLLALRLQSLLQQSLSGERLVFVSSDYNSIESGTPWYDAILEGIRNSQIVVVVLSPSSIARPWITFEAGIGVGQESSVMPVVWNGLPKNDVGLPLSHRQVRDLSDPEDLKGLFEDIAEICQAKLDASLLKPLSDELESLAAATPSVGLVAGLFRTGRRVSLEIRNTGTKPIELLEAEILIPQALLGDNTFHEYQPVLLRRNETVDNIHYVGNCLTTTPSTVLYLGVNALKPMLAPHSTYIPDHLGVSLPNNLAPEQGASMLRFSVSAKQFVYGPKTALISEIPVRSA